jgi:hypothetical protein
LKWSKRARRKLRAVEARIPTLMNVRRIQCATLSAYRSFNDPERGGPFVSAENVHDARTEDGHSLSSFRRPKLLRR